MITIVGTGHVFNISEPIMFLIKQIWPEVVMVELDMSRFNAMTNGRGPEGVDGRDIPWIYRSTARYQKKMSERYGSFVGNEMLTAVQTGTLVGAETVFIDNDAVNVMNEIWEEMSFCERTRYVLSSVRDRLGGKRRAEKIIDDYSRNEDGAVAEMRRKYPTLVRKLIDERNEYMAEKIAPFAEDHDEIVVVVGDLHVEGLSKLLTGHSIRKIRLGDILNKESFDRIRAEVWKG